MELYSPAAPKVAYIGEHAAPGAQLLGWLAQSCDVRVVPENRIGHAMRDLAQVQVLLLDANSTQAHLNCQQLRQAEPSQYLPVLGLGSRLPPQDVVRLLHHGAVDVVALPSDYEVLLAKIRSLAYRQAEIMMLHTINRSLVQDIEGFRAALWAGGGLPPQRQLAQVDSRLVNTGQQAGQDTSRRRAAGNPGLLDEVQRRAAALPDPVALFVIAALASTELLPLNLSSLILNALTRRVPLSRLGPIHHAFGDLVKHHLTSPRPAAPTTELAMLHACDSSGPAVEALRFVADLPTLLQPPPQYAS